jgi:hypothetical protein
MEQDELIYVILRMPPYGSIKLFVTITSVAVFSRTDADKLSVFVLQGLRMHAGTKIVFLLLSVVGFIFVLYESQLRKELRK